MIEDDSLAWYHLAICQGMKTIWFYEAYENDPVFAGIMDSICLSCPVRALCLKEGIENKEYGLWGGVYLDNGKADPAKNAHKTDDVWEVIRNGITG